MSHLWTTKSGDTIWIEDMTDSHLLNAYRMVCRIERSMAADTSDAYSFLGFLQGEMAIYYTESAVIEMENESAYVSSKKEILLEEIKKRKLEV